MRKKKSCNTAGVRPEAPKYSGKRPWPEPGHSAPVANFATVLGML